MENNIYDLAYAAGYIDGDGCLYIGRTETKKCLVYEYNVQVCSINPNIINWFKEKFGGATRTKERRINQKTPYVWTIKTRDAINLVMNIQPYLIAKHRESHYWIELALHIDQNGFKRVCKEGIEHRDTVIHKKRMMAIEDLVERNYVTNQWKNIHPSLTACEEEYAYLAGLIDAEGCLRIKHYSRKNRPNKVYNTCLEIGNTNKNFFSWLLMHFGGSVYFVKSTKPNKKNSATWILQAKALARILPKIIPYLKYKRPVAIKLIEFFDTTLPNGGDRHSEFFKQRYQTIMAQREKLVSEIHVLNAKGHKDS